MLLAEHRGHHDPRLVGDIAPMLNARLGVPTASRQDATSPIAHTWGVAVRPTSSQTTPLSSSMPLPSSQSVAGREPMPTTTRSASSSVPSDSTTFSTWSVPRTSSTPTPQRTSTPSARCSRVDQRADLLAEHRRQRGRLRFHQNDIHSHAAQAGGDLAADEARADHDSAAGRTGVLAQRDALVERAKHADALEIREETECVLGTSPVAMISSS